MSSKSSWSLGVTESNTFPIHPLNPLLKAYKLQHSSVLSLPSKVHSEREELRILRQKKRDFTENGNFYLIISDLLSLSLRVRDLGCLWEA